MLLHSTLVWLLPIIEHKIYRHGGRSWEWQCPLDKPHDDDDKLFRCHNLVDEFAEFTDFERVMKLDCWRLQLKCRLDRIERRMSLCSHKRVQHQLGDTSTVPSHTTTAQHLKSTEKLASFGFSIYVICKCLLNVMVASNKMKVVLGLCNSIIVVYRQQLPMSDHR